MSNNMLSSDKAKILVFFMCAAVLLADAFTHHRQYRRRYRPRVRTYRCSGGRRICQDTDEQTPPIPLRFDWSKSCGPNRRMCRGVKKCVSLSRVCDGNDDCGDNSDETNCPQTTIPPFTIDWSKSCGPNRKMCSGVKKCVSLSRVCDGNNDCGDNSDETNCPETTIPPFIVDWSRSCGPNRRMCSGVKKCVSLSRVCDGNDDCGDNSDETNCPETTIPPFIVDWSRSCGPNRRMCSGVKKCVSLSRVCDGSDDCGDNSDETNCPETTTAPFMVDWSKNCGPNRRMCSGVKKCVSLLKVCDGNDDCGDNSDETNCPETTTNPFRVDWSRSCGPNRRMCSGVKKCVSLSRVCDGNDDCGDNSDETDCPETTTAPFIVDWSKSCGPNRRMCTGVKKCVSLSRVCDGNDDCGDNSDETDCPETTTAPFITDWSNSCGPNRRMCSSVKKCVSLLRVCDGNNDCGDNSDETDCPETTIPPFMVDWSKSCGPNRRMCSGVKKCVSVLKVCDGNDDCGDNSDETGCPETTVD